MYLPEVLTLGYIDKIDFNHICIVNCCMKENIQGLKVYHFQIYHSAIQQAQHNQQRQKFKQLQPYIYLFRVSTFTLVHLHWSTVLMLFPTLR